MVDEAGLIRIETPVGAYWTRENDFVNAQLADYGGHQRSELGMFKSFVREGDVVLDVGAHIGTFSVPLAQHVGPSGRVYAFEPLAASYEILRKNLEENGVSDRVVATNALITDREGQYAASFEADHTSGAHFVRDAKSNGDGGAALPTLRLDEWLLDGEASIDRLDAMKVDTEGMELMVLRSAERLIERFRPVIMAEMCQSHLSRNGDSLADVHAFLRRFGYRYFRNLGERHATDEGFRLAKVWNPVYSVGLFDLVAVHPESPRLPTAFDSGLPMFAKWLGNRVRTAPSALSRRLSGR